MNEGQLEELENLLHIEVDDLSDEVMYQSELFYRVAKAYSQVAADRDSAKDFMKQVRSDAELSIREEIAEKGAKVTNPEIEAMVEVDDDVISAEKDFREKQAIAAKLNDLKEAWDQRSRALADLVKLYCANWFSDQATHINKPE